MTANGPALASRRASRWCEGIGQKLVASDQADIDGLTRHFQNGRVLVKGGSYPANSPTGDPARSDAKKQFSVSARPRVHPGRRHGGAFGLGIHMMR